MSKYVRMYPSMNVLIMECLDGNAHLVKLFTRTNYAACIYICVHIIVYVCV